MTQYDKKDLFINYYCIIQVKNKYLEQQVEKSSMLQSMCREVGNEHQLLLDPDSSVPGR